MGKGDGNNRLREMDKGDAQKGSSVKLKGLAWDAKAAQPAFLRDALAALQGPKESAPPPSSIDTNGRPAIPTRPGGEQEGGDEADESSEEDEWDMGRGDEAPAVVVLKEGRHLERDEVDRMRAQGELDTPESWDRGLETQELPQSKAKASAAPDPLASSSAPTKTKNSGSLTFSSGAASAGSSSGKRKVSELDADESWEDVIKRSKKAAEDRAAEIKKAKEDEAREKEKIEKKKRKEKKEQKKKVGRLSFADD